MSWSELPELLAAWARSKKGRLAMAVMLTAESFKQGNHDHRVTDGNVSVRLNVVEPDYELLRAVSGSPKGAFEVKLRDSCVSDSACGQRPVSPRPLEDPIEASPIWRRGGLCWSVGCRRPS